MDQVRVASADVDRLFDEICLPVGVDGDLQIVGTGSHITMICSEAAAWSRVVAEIPLNRVGRASEVVIERLQCERKRFSARAVTAVFRASRLWTDKVDEERDVRNDRAARARRPRRWRRRGGWCWRRRGGRRWTAASDTNDRGQVRAASRATDDAIGRISAACSIRVGRILETRAESSITERPAEGVVSATEVVIAERGCPE